MGEGKKASAAQMRATAKYEAAKYDKVLIRLPKGLKDRIQETGESINGFTVRAILDKLDNK